MPWVHLAKTVIGVVSLVWMCLALPLRAQEPEPGARLEQAYTLWQQGYVLHSFGRYESAANYFRQSIHSSQSSQASIQSFMSFIEPISKCVSWSEIR